MRATFHFLICSVSLVALSTPALAQEAAVDAGAINEIIVTAARHEQNLQKVSAAVSVFGGDDIKDKAMANVGQIFSDTPSIQATGQPGGFSVNVRGLGGDLPAGSTQGSSAIVFDGVYNINSQGATIGFFDVNRIEVSPGPQSTRYGPNADGGIVSVVTNDPKIGTLEGAASLTMGNYNLFRAEGMINVPLGKDLALRIAGAALSRDSYFTPDQGEQRAQSIRVKLLYRPSDDFNIKLGYQLDHIGGAGNGSNTFPVFTNKVPVYPGDSINDKGDPWSKGPSSNVNSANIYQHTLTGNLGYQFSSVAAIDVMASYSRLTGGETGTIYLPPWSTEAPPITAAKLNEFDPFHQFTTELRLHSAPGNPVVWNLGYYHWDYTWGYSLENALFLSAPTVTTKTATNALFGEVTYPVTDKLRLIGGLRHSWDHREFNFNNAGSVTPFFPINFTHFDYRAGVEFDATPQSMLYATVSTGYRPGGYSSYNPVTQAPNSFKSEVNTAFEFGSKNRFFDNRLQINADIFYYHIDNYQNLDKYTGFVPPEGGGPCGNGDTRAGCQTPTFGMKAHSLGIETQIVARPTDNDVFTVNATWTHAIFAKNQGTCATAGPVPGELGCWDGYNDQSTDALLFFNAAGAVQPHSPKFSSTVGYDHTFRFASGAKLQVGGSAFYTTGYWVNPVKDASLYGWQPGYWLEQLNAKFTSADERITLAAFMRNLSDYAVKASVLPATSLADPRTFGATFAVKF